MTVPRRARNHPTAKPTHTQAGGMQPRRDAETETAGQGFRSAKMGALALALALLSVAPPAARALVTSDGVGTHVVDPGVPAFGVNLDGVVWIGWEFFNSLHGTGALISDTHVLTAAHILNGADPFLLSVRFELPDGTVSIPVKGYAVHPGYDPAIIDEHDVAVLELASPAPAGVPRYELHTGSDEVGKTAVLTGYGQTGSGETGATFTDGNKRAGLNRFEATGADILATFPEAANIALNNMYADFDSGLAANDLTPLVAGSADLGFGDDEVGLAPGDSGGPAFIDGGDGVFRIAGINAARLDALDFPSYDALPGRNSSWGEFMSFARVSTNLDFINDALAGNLRRERIFDDGRTHVIDDGLDAGPVVVENSPADAATTVTLENAVVRTLSGERPALGVRGDSLVKFDAGLIEGSPAAAVQAGGRLHVSGGTIRALPPLPNHFDSSWAIIADNNAEVRISGGTIKGIRRAVRSRDNSQVFITGGTFHAEDEAIDARGSSTVHITGGTFTGTQDGLYASSAATVQIFGGSFAGGESDFYLEDAAVLEIHGYGFNHPVGPVADEFGTISGFYRDGTAFSHTFDRYDDSVIELVFSRIPPPRGRSQLSLSRASRFGPTEIGSRSRTQRIRVNNTGTLAAEGLRVRTTGRGKRDFVVTRPADRVLAPGESTVFRVTFRPRKVGRRKAEAKVLSSASPVSLRLKGRAVPKEVAPRSPFLFPKRSGSHPTH